MLLKVTRRISIRDSSRASLLPVLQVLQVCKYSITRFISFCKHAMLAAIFIIAVYYKDCYEENAYGFTFFSTFPSLCASSSSAHKFLFLVLLLFKKKNRINATVPERCCSAIFLKSCEDFLLYLKTSGILMLLKGFYSKVYNERTYKWSFTCWLTLNV